MSYLSKPHTPHTTEDLNVRCFYSSPRHADHFRVDKQVRAKIVDRFDTLNSTGRLPNKTIIVNVQQRPSLVELHDGNASVVAWLIFTQSMQIAPSLGALQKSFDQVVILKNRTHDNGEVWHPFVPIEVACADQLTPVFDAEHQQTARKALSLRGEPIFFNDTNFFSGQDAAQRLGTIADEFII